MRSITRLFGAFGTLADSVLALAGVIDVAAGRLRLQLADDSAPQLGHGSPTAEIVDPGANSAIAELASSTKRGKVKCCLRIFSRPHCAVLRCITSYRVAAKKA